MFPPCLVCYFVFQGSSGMDVDSSWNAASAVQRNVTMMPPRYSQPPAVQQAPIKGNGLLFLWYQSWWVSVLAGFRVPINCDRCRIHDILIHVFKRKLSVMTTKTDPNPYPQTVLIQTSHSRKHYRWQPLALLVELNCSLSQHLPSLMNRSWKTSSVASLHSSTSNSFR